MRVVVVEDQALLREGIVALLREQGVEVVATGRGRGGSAAGGRRRIIPTSPSSTSGCRRRSPTRGYAPRSTARERQPGLGVLILSQYVEPAYTAELLEVGEGGVGYLLKERVGEVRTFIDAIERVAGGGTVIDREVVSRLVRAGEPGGADSDLATLTPREREVLELMAEGRTNAGIARALVVTQGAVEKHISGIFGKLDLPAGGDDHRRVLAVLAYLRAAAG